MKKYTYLLWLAVSLLATNATLASSGDKTAKRAVAAIPASSYELADGGKTLKKWKGSETVIDMQSDPVLKDITKIGDDAFQNKSTITSITIPTSVTTIGTTAFYRCSGLNSLTIGNSVTTIGNYAFASCSRLTSVTIPNSVTTIEDHAFAGCSGLTSITISTSLTTIGNFAFAGCSGLTSLIIPNSVTAIGRSAFSICSGLTSLTIGNSVITIGRSAFDSCSGLTSIIIPNSVTTIGNTAFSNCSKLATVTAKGATPATLGANVWRNIKSGAKLYVPAGALATYQAKADWTNGFGSIHAFIPASSYELSDGGKTLKRWKGTETVINMQSDPVLKDITKIGYNAFKGNTIITSLTIGNLVTTIGNAAFLGCSGLTSITIPNSVTAIGNAAFLGGSGLTSLTIGNSVTNIGNDAFNSCSSLTSITIPNSVTTIGAGAFAGCSGLTSITIPTSVTNIGHKAFINCSKLATVTAKRATPATLGPNVWRNIKSGAKLYVPAGALATYQAKADWTNGFGSIHAFIPASSYELSADKKTLTKWKGTETVIDMQSDPVLKDITKIGTNAFGGNNKLVSVTLPDGLTTIQEDGFVRCSKLTSVTLPSSLETIGVGGFYQCVKLGSIILPVSLTNIERQAFDGCSGLAIVTAKRATPATLSTDVWKNIETGAKLYVPSGAVATYQANSDWKNSFSSIKAFIPSSSYELSDGGKTLKKWKGTETVINRQNDPVLKDITKIGAGAFQNNTTITSVTIPNLVTTIGQEAFDGCSQLATVIAKGATPATLGTDVWKNIKTGAKLYVLADAVAAYQANSDWKNSFSSINTFIPSSSYELSDGGKTLKRWKGTETVIDMQSDPVLKDITKIEDKAFQRNTTITSITIPNSVTTIGNFAFHGCRGLTSITIPNSVTTIGDHAFNACIALTSVNIPNSVTTIGDHTFKGCSGLTSITIPNSVTTIGNFTFYRCIALTSVTIPNSVTTIGYSAFRDCRGLTTVTIPSSVTNIERRAFDDCRKLATVIAKAATPATLGSNVWRNIKTGAKLYVPAGAVATYQAKAGWTSSFSSINTFIPASSYKLSDGGKTLKKWDGTETVIDMQSDPILQDITKIGDNTFKDNATLTSIKLSSGVTSIGQNTFTNCNKLASIILPANVTNIGKEAFSNMISLKKVAVLANNPSSITLGNEVWKGNDKSKMTLYVPKGTKASYEQAAQWKDFGTIKELADTNSYKIADNGKSLQSWTGQETEIDLQTPVLNQITEIASSAFFGKTKITSIKLPEKLKTIGTAAFQTTEKLTAMELPSTVTSIGELAFSGSGIQQITLPAGIKTIGNEAFSSTSSLKVVEIQATNPSTITLGTDIWKNNDKSKMTLYVPKGSKTLYDQATQWKDFGAIAEPLEASVTKTDITCNGKKDGTAIAKTVGGAALFTYKWSNDATTASISSLVAGKYTVTITDKNGKTAQAEVTITEPTAIPVPTVTATQKFVDAAKVSDLIATGENLKWYAKETGGTPLAVTAVLTNNTKYYVSQTKGGCESARATVTATINTITDFAAMTKTYGDAAFDLSAKSTAGTITYSVVSGGDLVTLSGNKVTIKGTGKVKFKAIAQATATHSEASKTITLTIAKANQTITFAKPADVDFSKNKTVTLGATASSSLVVSYKLLKGTGTITGNVLTISAVGTFEVQATQVGDKNYNAAKAVSQSFQVNKGANAITNFTAMTKTYGDAAFDLSAKATAGIITYSIVSGGDLITLSGNKVTIKGAGEAKLKATAQATATHSEASKTITLTIAKANQTITFAKPADVDFSKNKTVTLGATASSSLTVSYKLLKGKGTIKGNVLTIAEAGTFEVQATQTGDKNYNAAQAVSQSFQVTEPAKPLGLNNTNILTYPNPATDYILVKTATNQPLAVFDMYGRQLVSGKTNERVDVSQLSAGTYFIRLSSGELVKFIVKH